MDGDMGGDGRTVNRLGTWTERWMVEWLMEKLRDREGNVNGRRTAEGHWLGLR